MRPAAGCRAVLEGDCEAGPCDDAAGPIVDQGVLRHADWKAGPALRIQNSEGPLWVYSVEKLGSRSRASDTEKFDLSDRSRSDDRDVGKG